MNKITTNYASLLLLILIGILSKNFNFFVQWQKVPVCWLKFEVDKFL